MKNIQEMKHKELLALPTVERYGTSVYDSILLVPARTQHDSGWMCIAVVGVLEGKAKEIASFPDSITWSGNMERLKTDCTWPSGVVHFWTREAKFEVEHGYSSCDIKLI